MAEIRVARVGDEEALEVFLAGRPESSMFLRSNLRTVGLVDRGEPYQGTYAVALEGSRITAVAAHLRNGELLLQAPAALDETVWGAVRASGRPVSGFIGPWAQAVRARDALGLGSARARKTSRELLFSLDLGELVVPPALGEGTLRCRAPRDAELSLLSAWRAAYHIEELEAAESDSLRSRCAEEIARMQRERRHWVVAGVDGAPVAYSAFNARLPDVVQIGGVWTPPPLRSCGYARAVVAGSLLEARAAGVGRSVLFTAEHNVPAQRAYRALGYREVGDYALILLAEPMAPAYPPPETG